jgi:hypothetical protein
MCAQMSLTAPERETSSAPANLRSASETGTGFEIPPPTFGFAASACAAAAAGFLAPAAGDMRKRHPRNTLATAAIVAGASHSYSLSALASRIGREGRRPGFRVTDSCDFVSGNRKGWGVGAERPTAFAPRTSRLC